MTINELALMSNAQSRFIDCKIVGYKIQALEKRNLPACNADDGTDECNSECFCACACSGEC